MSQTKPPKAVQFLEEALSIAQTFSHPYVGVEHVFLAALENGTLNGAVSSIGSSREAAIQILRDRISPGDTQVFPESFPRTPRLKRVLDRAMQNALSQKQSDLSISLILESILEEKMGLVALALTDLGTTPEMVARNLVKPVSPISSEKEKKKNTPLLNKLGRDLTELAHLEKLDPVIGRSEELRRVMQILTRKTKNVPVLVGEPGVGKTAVVYALAQRLAKQNVPQALVGKRLIELPLGNLVAGTPHRGELEERVQKLIRELSEDPNLIVFIDEIHGIIGAGNLKGGLDIANLLKPSLADGSIRVIGATTTDEYQKYLSHDQALERRLQPVLVKEPSEEDTSKILEGLKARYEKHHGVTFDEEAIHTAIKLSLRYLPDRHLPDKALDLLDEAASRVKTKTGAGLLPRVTGDDIAEVTSMWTGIPVQKLTSSEKERLLQLEERLKGRVVGQDEAIGKLAQTIRVASAGLGNPKRPVGVFLFLGPTGVGKTELAKALADLYYGTVDAMIRLDMSEYKEQHTVAKLIGSPPGYIGHDEEGQLTKAIHAKPYSLLLLDEIEKAHPEVFDLFLQIFDEGRLTDSKGRTVNFTNALIIMTSNLGSQKILQALEKGEDKAKVNDLVLAELKAFFRPEFLNRIDEIILFNPLTQTSLQTIAKLQLRELQERLADQRLTLLPSDALIELLIQKGYEPAFGARPLRRMVQQLLSKPLADALLEGKFPEGSTIIADLVGDTVTFTLGGHE